MSEHNGGKSTQVSAEPTETVKLPDLYTAMAGICYNNSQKLDENRSLIEHPQHSDHSPSQQPSLKNEESSSDEDKQSTAVTTGSSESVAHCQTYHSTEAKNQLLSSHQIPGYSSWEQLSCPSLQNYHGAQVINPLAAAQYSEYYNLSSRSGGVVYEDWQYPVYYSNYYDTGTDMSKYCDQKTSDTTTSYEKSKMTIENCHDSGSDRTCSTPDLVLSVLQMENQIKSEMSKERLSHWYSPVSSPECSPATPLMSESPAPSTEQDSGFFSEDPVSPIFMSHKQTLTQMEETNQKYFVYVPENTEDWKNYHHINPVPLMCSDMTRKMVNKSAICGWKPTSGYPIFSPEMLGRNSGYKTESESWQMPKYNQFPLPISGKGHKHIKTKAQRPTRCVTPMPSSTVTSGSNQVQSDAVSSTLTPSSAMFQGQSQATKASPTSAPVVPLPSTKSTKDIVDSFINRKSGAVNVQTVKPSNPVKRKSSEVDDKSSLCSKRARHNEPLNQDAISVMQRWYEQNKENPYPSKQDKEDIARLGGISITQVKSWFANKRNRTNNTRPKVQKRNVEEKLLDLCHQLASDARKSTMDNAFVIQQLSAIIDEHHAVH
ncbi:hypothetical protein SNE40_008726 [Patella caerulea]|uniref:Homeobox domain-containing protein n=1 Tax=Patella caerulea TaxID=87958 RepID=A0AAN8JV56_PATCE